MESSRKRLCEDLKVGDRYTVRRETDITGQFGENDEVEIESLNERDEGIPSCSSSEARLVKFKGRHLKYHPLWIIDCHECPFYNPYWKGAT